MTNRFKGILAGGVMATLTTLSPVTAQAQEHSFKLHHLLSAKSPAHKNMLEPWARQVEKNSAGKVKIEIFPSMSLGGKPPELIQQARDGVVDIVWTVNGYTPGLFPRTEVFELPGVYTNNTVATNLSMYDMFESDLKQEYKGVEVMWLHVHAGQAIMTVDKEVRSPADMAGMKMRIPTRTGAWVIEALGASPLATPVPEVPTALSKKTIDGTLLPWEIIPPLKLQNQINYFIEGVDKTRLGTTTFQVSMNANRWKGLPDDIKKAFKDASGRDWWAKVGEYWRAGDDFGIGLAVKAGKKHITLTQQETKVFMDTLEPVVSRWVSEVESKGIDGAALVTKARALSAKNAR
ncbi:MAG: TRAP transporter substrate-binding protein [Burkholderiaceae bacterium]